METKNKRKLIIFFGLLLISLLFIIYFLANRDLANDIGLVSPEYSSSQITKLDSDGNQVWGQQFISVKYDHNYPVAFIIDKYDNIYVCGNSLKNTGAGITTGYYLNKYDEQGQLIWSSIEESNEVNKLLNIRSSVIDTEGNIYVTGSDSTLSSTTSIFITKWDTHGRQIWMKRYTHPQNKNNDPSALCLDHLGNVIVSGNTDKEYLTLKYDTKGNELWAVTFNNTGNVSNIAHDLVIDEENNIFVVGESIGENLDIDFMTIKYSPEGKEIWAIAYNGNGNDIPCDIKLDLSGNIVVTGESISSSGKVEVATINYDTNGHTIWVNHYTENNNLSIKPVKLAIDKDGNIYMGGEAANNPNGSDYIILKLNKIGEQQWVERYHSSNSGLNKMSSISVDNEGNIYVTGNNIHHDQTASCDTLRYNPGGELLWVSKIVNLFFLDIPIDIAVDNNKNIIIVMPSSKLSSRNK